MEFVSCTIQNEFHPDRILFQIKKLFPFLAPILSNLNYYTNFEFEKKIYLIQIAH